YWSANQADADADTQSIGAACGVIQLAHTAAEENLHAQLRAPFAHAEDLVRFVNEEEASDIAGITLTCSGLYFPSAGWLDPTRLCTALVDHPDIKILCHSDALHLIKGDDHWQVLLSDQQR